MISDPLTLAIVSMIVGMLFGAISSVLAVMISNNLHKDDVYYPSEQDMDQMSLWYEEEYHGKHE